ncbi:hypothetical protein BH10PSE1_BH10PSE1_22890 [soil metagenome]
MNRLTPMEWARTKEPISHLSLASRGASDPQRMVAWLEARTGSGWFYVSGDNDHFGSAADATAFRQWLASVPAGI